MGVLLKLFEKGNKSMIAKYYKDKVIFSFEEDGHTSEDKEMSPLKFDIMIEKQGWIFKSMRYQTYEN